MRLIHTMRAIRTLTQRQEVNRLTTKVKNLQANLVIYIEDFVHIVNRIIKFYEKVQNLI